MTTYSAITNSEIAVGAPVTNNLKTKERDNLLAIQENDASAPTIAYATAAGSAGTITSQGALAILDAAGQGELNTASGIVSTTTTAIRLVLPGGSFGMYPRTRMSTTNSSNYLAAMSSPIKTTGLSHAYTGVTSYASQIVLGTGSGTIYSEQEYIQASPPYDLGDGVVGRFIFALIDNTTGHVDAAYQAPEAPWHYNGPTNIQGKLMPDGKKYRPRKDMSGHGLSFAQAKLNTSTLRAYNLAFKDAPTIQEEITQDIKQADIGLIPHPFMSNDLTGKTVVMLDPVSDLNHELNEVAREHDEFSLNDLLHDGYLEISNTGLARSGPSGILIPSFKWKNTI